MVKVIATTSKTFQRVNNVPPVTLTWGPYKYAKAARKKATAVHKDRAVFDCGQGFKDYGPTFSRSSVQIIEVKELR